MPAPLSQVGRYQIVDKLGQGGMGSLYLARDPAIDRLVAIKLLRDDFDNLELRERFAREARSAGRLRHPNIVIVFDVGEHEGQPFIAMEYIPGETLSAIVKRGTRLEAIRMLTIVEDICAGLDYAHDAGIVHRDIKPANIMIDSSGVVKILDFGIAHVAESGMTQSGSVVGTLNYMAPEQVMGKPIDRRCDVFAVGAVLYELVALRQAFPGGLQEGILNRIVNDEPVPLAELHPGVSPALERIVKKSLEKDPADRYADLGQMQKDLNSLRKSIPEPVRSGMDAVTMPIGALRAPDAVQARRETDREALLKRRASEIEEHLRAADIAFEAGEYQAAISACERAALLDPDGAHALDLMARARTAMEGGRVLQLVGEARAQLHEGALTKAVELLDKASVAGQTLHSGSAAAAALKRAQIDLEQARERTELVRKTIQRAESALRGKEFDSAIRNANEALALEPALTQALDVRRRAQAALEDRRREPQVQTAPAPVPRASEVRDRAETPQAPVPPTQRPLRRSRVPAVIAGALIAAGVLGFARWRGLLPSGEIEAPKSATQGPSASETAPPQTLAGPSGSEATASPPADGTAASPPVQTDTQAAALGRTPPATRAQPRPPGPITPRTFGTTQAERDQAAIRQTIQRYSAAFESLDPAGVKAVQPSANLRALALLFRGYSSLKQDAQVGGIEIGPNGQLASASAFVTTTPVLKATGQPGMTQRRQLVIWLRKEGDGWVIQELNAPGRRGEAGGRIGDAELLGRRGRQQP